MAPPVLWHFRFSHYNEKARWALDWKGIPHVRRHVAPGPHAQQVLELSGQRAVPVLEWDGKVTADSTAIIAMLEAARPAPPLYPCDARDRTSALTLEDFFDEDIGPHTRRLAWHTLLPDRAFCEALFSDGFGPDLRDFYAKAFPMIEQVMRAEMAIDDAGAADSRAKVAVALDRIERERNGRDYLVGDAFSVADLTAAALLAPVIVPPEFPYTFPEPRPAAFEAMRAEFTSHPGCRWALETYGRHRGTSAEVRSSTTPT
jgi:glutathione S-transferase